MIKKRTNYEEKGSNMKEPTKPTKPTMNPPTKPNTRSLHWWLRWWSGKPMREVYTHVLKLPLAQEVDVKDKAAILVLTAWIGQEGFIEADSRLGQRKAPRLVIEA